MRSVFSKAIFYTLKISKIRPYFSDFLDLKIKKLVMQPLKYLISTY